jgi:sugar phosphate isomerase/epimerase
MMIRACILAVLAVRTTLCLAAGATCATGSANAWTAMQDGTGKASGTRIESPPLFAFDNGTGRGELPPRKQAALVAESGYSGIAYNGTQGIPEMLAALDARHLEMLAIYVRAEVGPKGATYDPGLMTAIRRLKGRDTIIWLHVVGRDKDDRQTVPLVREIADLAAEAGLRVALYPHTGFHVATVQDALRVRAKVDRKNVGVTFNLCHFLKLDRPANLEATLKAAVPHMFLVTINGADADGRDWSTLIQTLDHGSFDVGALLVTLDRLGYRGPFCLQCYQIKGDRHENLRRSMEAWRRFHTNMRQPQP